MHQLGRIVELLVPKVRDLRAGETSSENLYILSQMESPVRISRSNHTTLKGVDVVGEECLSGLAHRFLLFRLSRFYSS
jgi:hypothetical protein